MDWTSIEDGLPNDGEESVVVGMKSDGSIVQLIGYRENGNWVMEDEAAAAGRPVELAAADKVDVQVKDRLSGAGADVKNGAVSVLDAALAGDFGGCEMTAADHFGVSASCFFQSGKVFFWNH